MEKFFKLWKGNNYIGGIFLLAEAHICGECSCEVCEKCKDENCINGHIRLINEHIDTGGVQTYSRFEKEFTGASLNTKEKREYFWHGFIFTNFLSVAMPESGEAPDAQYYSDEARERFLALLSQYKPKYVLVWGERTFSSLPGDSKNGMWEKVTFNAPNDQFDYWWLNFDGLKIKVLQIYHPAWIGMSNADFEKTAKRNKIFLKDEV
jgi:hypothetical protein